MKNRILIIGITSLFFLFNFSGIIRHDTDKTNYESLARKKEFLGVGQIFCDTFPKGSAVLISKNYIITAAHLFDEIETTNQNLTIRFETFDSVNKRKVKFCYKISEFTVHPEYKNTKECDIAICKLKNDVHFKPAVINKKFNELNSIAICVGYGASGKSTDLEKIVSKNEKLAGQNTIDSIGGFLYKKIPTILYCDFDDPERIATNRMGNVSPTDFEIICSGGDSGGGIFRINNEGDGELLGICKGGGIDPYLLIKNMSYYGQIAEYTRVAPFYEWIYQHINQ